MRDIARRPEKDRRDLFRATAERKRIHEAIVEKDFWVCWALDYLFADSPWKDCLAFKGGTSLSKAFNAIERFSEDIDVILDWKLLGYEEGEAWEARSAAQQDKFGKEAGRRTAAFLETELVPTFDYALKERLAAVGADVGISVRQEDQIILLQYPKAFSLAGIQPQVRLELGPMAEAVPNEQRRISPFAAEEFPTLFKQRDTTVRTILAERTFREKATILHQEAHRDAARPLPPRYSRHYYDLYRLSTSPFGSRR